mmetsp:Transcript_49270/g.141677  ORF Transcript_49270/g.141677 Transcript_49270/m.141677 type:complete len:245 (+) Transcript_49270:372-1106(+)
MTHTTSPRRNRPLLRRCTPPASRASISYALDEPRSCARANKSLPALFCQRPQTSKGTESRSSASVSALSCVTARKHDIFLMVSWSFEIAPTTCCRCAVLPVVLGAPDGLEGFCGLSSRTPRTPCRLRFRLWRGGNNNTMGLGAECASSPGNRKARSLSGAAVDAWLLLLLPSAEVASPTCSATAFGTMADSSPSRSLYLRRGLDKSNRGGMAPGCSLFKDLGDLPGIDAISRNSCTCEERNWRA